MNEELKKVKELIKINNEDSKKELFEICIKKIDNLNKILEYISGFPSYDLDNLSKSSSISFNEKGIHITLVYENNQPNKFFSLEFKCFEDGFEENYFNEKVKSELDYINYREKKLSKELETVKLEKEILEKRGNYELYRQKAEKYLS